MAAATQNVETPRQTGEIVYQPMGAAKKIYRGTLVSVDGTTENAEAATNAATKAFAGVAVEEMDNSAGAARAKNIRLYRTGLHEFKYTGSAPAYGALLYVSDDQTVTATAGGTPVLCGRNVRTNTANTTVLLDIEAAFRFELDT